MQTMPHLHFNGNCTEAFRFYAKTFNGKIVFSMTYGDSPAADTVSPESRDQVIHARVDIGEQMLAGCDVPHSRYEKPQGFNVIASVDEPTDAECIFNTLAERGAVTMPIGETFWAHKFGMCTDRYGTPWMVNCPKPTDGASGNSARVA
jgi:PhnB protein